MSKGKGLVYKSTGSWYAVQDAGHRMWLGRMKGKLRIDQEISSTNPIAVGDIVRYELEEEAANTVMILDIEPRRNYIVRVSPHNRHQKHIVAANLDTALLMATIAEPRTSQGFIDRFLVTAEAYHIPVILVINKVDLLDEGHREQLAHWKQMYEGAGYEVFPIAALQPETIVGLRHRLKDQTTLFSGHSGVGKSTLINQLIPDLSLRTAEVSGWSGKGLHTTTFAEMYDLPGGGRIIDTPGVKEFGLIDLERELLSHYFPEMRAVLSGCRFNNCLHLNEPGCAVKEAVTEGRIMGDRYISYLGLLESLGKQW